jgi:hypothetical protein
MKPDRQTLSGAIGIVKLEKGVRRANVPEL